MKPRTYTVVIGGQNRTTIPVLSDSNQAHTDLDPVALLNMGHARIEKFYSQLMHHKEIMSNRKDHRESTARGERI
ncbi:MAG TPA: hypothetical protein VKC53_02565 [Patescibacteria group bacterium]|nr:hypothetical protein [Patescibacteria group bacterium]